MQILILNVNNKNSFIFTVREIKSKALRDRTARSPRSFCCRSPAGTECSWLFHTSFRRIQIARHSMGLPKQICITTILHRLAESRPPHIHPPHTSDRPPNAFERPPNERHSYSLWWGLMHTHPPYSTDPTHSLHTMCIWSCFPSLYNMHVNDKSHIVYPLVSERWINVDWEMCIIWLRMQFRSAFLHFVTICQKYPKSIKGGPVGSAGKTSQNLHAFRSSFSNR